MKTKYNPHSGTFDFYNEDKHKGILNVNCIVPTVIFELQMRRVIKMKVTERKDDLGESLGNKIEKFPDTWTSRISDWGDWWIYLRYFGEIGGLQNPKIAILHKARSTVTRQKPNPSYGKQIAQRPDGNSVDIDVSTQVFVEKEYRKGWRLLHDNEAQPMFYDLPEKQAVWTPFMSMTDFIKLFVVNGATKFSYSRRAADKMNYQRVGVALTSEFDFLNEEGTPERVFLTHASNFVTIKRDFKHDTYDIEL